MDAVTGLAERFVCPLCGAASSSPGDIAHGYCGRCHAFTRHPEAALWWLSFVDPDRAAPAGEQVPGGPGFLGVAIVPARDFLAAVEVARAFGCNPGGEVQGSLLPAGPITDGYPLFRLLTFDEVGDLPPWCDPSGLPLG